MNAFFSTQGDLFERQECPPNCPYPEPASPVVEVVLTARLTEKLPATINVSPPRRKPAAAEWTAAELRKTIANLEISDKKRRDLVTAINHANTIMGSAMANLAGQPPWSCAGLNRVLWARPYTAYGLSAGVFRNMLSNLRTVLTHAGLHADSRYGANALSPEWARVYGTIPTEERRRSLQRFFRFLTLQGITPAKLTPETINAFDTWCRTEILLEDPTGMSRRAASNWEFCRRHVPGWPPVEMRRACMRDQYSLGWDEYPASFAADAERFLAGLAAGPGIREKLRNPYRALAAAPKDAPAATRPRGLRRALSARTIATRHWQMRVAAAALVRSGELPVDRITSLAVLVTPVENAATILEFHEGRLRQQKHERGEAVPEQFLSSSQLAGIAEVLRQIAKYEAKLPPEDMDILQDYLAAVTPAQPLQMCKGNADRLKRLFEEKTYAELLHLPGYWMDLLGKQNLTPLERALTAMYATALEILLFLPLRRGNCAKLRLDINLRRPNPTALVQEIYIPGHMVKNGVDIIWPVDPASAQLIETYLRVHRPLLAQPGNPFLFPGLGNSHRNECDFGTQLSRRVTLAIGAEFNCHLVRHFAVVRYLRLHPGAYETAAQILGHKNPDTTRRFYCGLEIDAAARQVNATLAEARRATKVLAIGPYHKPARRRRKPGAR